MLPSDGSEQCPITGRVYLVVNRAIVVSLSAVVVPVHDSLPS